MLNFCASIFFRAVRVEDALYLAVAQKIMQTSFHCAVGAAFHTTTRVNAAPIFAVGVVVLLRVFRL